MGYDESYNTIGYCETSDIPSFKIYSNSMGLFLDLEGSFPAWSDLNTYVINNQINDFPTKFDMLPAYPNPFNPITHIEYSVPYKTMVTITIYDLMGRELQKLTNKEHNSGYYSLDWDASMVSSGVYFVKMKTNDFQASQKLLLIK
jgi:hypothetical protein